ncbi:MAG: hypothetical protein AUK47_19930 [Deltaproteobacteria bacterium CG2_30_63_29]|nr:MAG: hypothetical protein AUK47_19930 [Deltaproteobacteria bacterium CG2_30_63_29]
MVANNPQLPSGRPIRSASKKRSWASEAINPKMTDGDQERSVGVSSLVIMLDWENFPGIRPAEHPLPFPLIIDFLARHYELKAALAYAHRATLSPQWEQKLVELGFEIRLLDGLVDANDKKNSLDLCLAMDAVRMSYINTPDAYALLVAGDKDFAVVSAFIRRKLELQVVAFGSLYCPNPSLAEQVDRYFMLEQVDDWDRQLVEGTSKYVPNPFGEVVLRRAESQRPYIIAGLFEIGPDVPRPVGALIPAIRRHHPDYNTRGQLRLATVLEALGCQLSADRQTVLSWAGSLLEVARSKAGNLWRLPADVPETRYVKDRRRLTRIAVCVRDGFALLGIRARYPLPLSVLHAAILESSAEIRTLLTKRLRLWHALTDLGFELNEEHTIVRRALTSTAQMIVEQGRALRQLPLFASEESAPKPVFVAAPSTIESRTNVLAQRIRLRQRLSPYGPLFAALQHVTVQGSLPFANRDGLST